jgi:hypothetical protein
MYGLLECQSTAAVVAGKLQCDNADSNREQQHGKNVVYKENHDRNCRTAYKYHQQQTKQNSMIIIAKLAASLGHSSWQGAAAVLAAACALSSQSGRCQPTASLMLLLVVVVEQTSKILKQQLQTQV